MRFIGIRPCGLTPVLSSRVGIMSMRPMPAMMRFMSGRPEKSEFETRAIQLLSGFDKIDSKKLNMDAHFTKDLGLDSLDTVEVLMAIEDEFLIEIPDQEADQIHTVRQAIDYVYDRWTPEHNW